MRVLLVAPVRVCHCLLTAVLPICSQSYQESIPRDTEPGSAVLRISATDADSDENGTVEYRLNTLRQTDNGYFDVDPRTGVITLTQRMDGVSSEYRGV